MDKPDLEWQIARETPHLRRYGHALTGNRDDGDDLTQACLERALRKRALWKRRGSLRSWLFRIQYTLYVERKRTRKREVSMPDPALSEAQGTPARQDQLLTCRSVVEALDTLPDDQRAALLLVALEDMSYDDAAAALGIPIGTLRSRIWRARESLRKCLVPAQAKLKRVK
ncbi:sigma-70 family RNA polymerase sigma factor [Caenispirillum salinarum]|uniref:sigma-70 family RNA polymerase sigma factor n=1 Tax=Caenispirillum salinarum TaxID=859058 RepID=UPI00384D4E4E